MLSLPPFLTDNALLSWLEPGYFCLSLLTAPQQLIAVNQQPEVLTHEVNSLQTTPKQILGQLKLQGQHLFWRILMEVRNKQLLYELHKTALVWTPLGAEDLKHNNLLES